MDRITEEEYIAAYGANRPVSDATRQHARDILRKEAFNGVYIPPTNDDAILLQFALMYRAKYNETVKKLADVSKELSKLKRDK